MNLIKTIIAKEFIGYFKNYTAYIVLGVYLVLSFAIMFYSAYFFEYNNQNLISFFVWQPDILNILVPALTMKMWAEEHRSGTLEFLLTQPVKIKTFVWGKFLASWLFSCLLILMTIPFMIYISSFIALDFLNITVSVLAVILVMSALCALGCLVSAFCKNGIIAYLASVFFGWGMENMTFSTLLKPINVVFPLLKQRLENVFSFRIHYQELIEGQLSTESIFYFLSLCVLMLWLNVIIVQRYKR